VPGCDARAGDGCPGGAACTTGQCPGAGAACTSDAACAAPFRRCDTSVAGGQCVQCLADGDCGAGLLCDPTARRCVECLPGGAGACSANLAGARCTAAGVCGCASDADCGGVTSGRVCDPTTSRCVPGCHATGNVCPDAVACSSATDAIGQCQSPPAPDAGADAGTDTGPSGDGGADAAQDQFAEDVAPDLAGTDATTGEPPAMDGAMADGAGTDGAASDGATSDGATSDGDLRDGAKADGANERSPLGVGPDGYLAGGGCNCELGAARAPDAGALLLLAVSLVLLGARRSRRRRSHSVPEVGAGRSPPR